MTKTRIILSLTGILIILAVTASTAAAKWVTNNGTGHGPLQLVPAGEESAKFNLSPGGIHVFCETLAKGEWKIRELTKQTEATEGDHLNITGQFTKCFEKIGGIKNPATVNSTCEIQIEQHGTTFTGGVTSPCTVTQPAKGCEIKIAAIPANTGLKEVKAVNVESKNQEDPAKVTGITSTATKCGTEGGKESSFEAIAIADEVKTV